MDGKPVLLVDVDGVLADFDGSLFEEVRALGFEAPLNAPHFELKLCLDKKALKAAHGILDGSPFARRVKPMPGAVEALKTLAEHADIHILTSPWIDNPTWESDRRDWLALHFGIHESKIVSTNAKHLVHGAVFIDDRMKHLEGWAARHGKAGALLMSHTHNAGGEYPRLYGWDEHSVAIVIAVLREAGGFCPECIGMVSSHDPDCPRFPF